MKIKSIIFDMGGVILNIDNKKSLEAFTKLGVLQAGAELEKNRVLIDDFGSGKYTAVEFRKKLKQNLDLPISDAEFDNAWNAMLLDLPLKRLQSIQNLNDYKIYLLSNTNSIHLDAIRHQVSQRYGIQSFQAFFQKEYYSHVTGHRKPAAEAYQQILRENNLSADETLFIDDTASCVEGARQVGMHGLQLKGELAEFDFKSYIHHLEQTLTPELGQVAAFSI